MKSKKKLIKNQTNINNLNNSQTDTHYKQRNFSSLIINNNKHKFNETTQTLLNIKPRLKSSDQKFR